jgi:hypothetical protein
MELLLGLEALNKLLEVPQVWELLHLLLVEA